LQATKRTKTNLEGEKMEMVKKFFNDESGASMVEYGLLVALIACACIVAIGVLSGGIQAIFNAAGTELTNAVPS
jgi:pilus assembly protein Flp/PilA